MLFNCLHDLTMSFQISDYLKSIIYAEAQNSHFFPHAGTVLIHLTEQHVYILTKVKVAITCRIFIIHYCLPRILVTENNPLLPIRIPNMRSIINIFKNTTSVLVVYIKT